MKDKLTSFDVAALVIELDQLAKNSRIKNIYQLNSTTLLLKLQTPIRNHLNLLIEAGRTAHLTSYTRDKPRNPPAFCMALRKHLRNGKVKEIGQHQFERILVIEVITRKKSFKLISELFGDGNIILVSPENIILHTLTPLKMRDRNVLRGETFQYPPSSGRNPFTQTRQDFDVIREMGKLEIVKALTKFFSIGGLYAEEILLRAQINKKISCNSMTKKHIDRMYEELQRILSSFQKGSLKPHTYLDDRGEFIDVTPIPIKKHLKSRSKQYKTINEALDDYYIDTEQKEDITRAASTLNSELSRQHRILQRQQTAIENLKDQIERNKMIGDAIYLHFNALNSLIQKINEDTQKRKYWTHILTGIEERKKAEQAPEVYFQSIGPKRQIINVSIEDLSFSISLRRSIQSSANKYYTISKKALRKLEGVRKAIINTQLEIKKLKNKIRLAKETRQPQAKHYKRRKKEWYEKFRWFHSSDGYLVIGGRDATTNEVLLKKYLEPNDIVFHADFLGAPFVVIKTGGRIAPEQTMKEAAQQAASYSRAWREMLNTINVYWFSPNQISKSPPPGQYLTKGAFTIQGTKNYYRGIQLQIAIGLIKKEEQIIVIGGPVKAISNQSNFYVKIAPGRKSSSRLARQIQDQLTEKTLAVWGTESSKIPIEEIQRFIPLGRGTIERP